MASPVKGIVAAVVFSAAAIAALPLAQLPGNGRSDSAHMAELEELEARMRGGASFHPPAGTPALPATGGFCESCHPWPPHPGDGIEMAFLNRHSADFECLVCHWSSLSGERPSPSWAAMAPKGSGGPRSYLTLPPDQSGERFDPAAAREEILASRECFDRGPSCKDCHRKGSMGEYVKADTPPHRLMRLERLPDFFFPQKDGKWYFQ